MKVKLAEAGSRFRVPLAMRQHICNAKLAAGFRQQLTYSLGAILRLGQHSLDGVLCEATLRDEQRHDILLLRFLAPCARSMRR